MAAPTTGSLGIILDSSILVAFERRRFDLERFLAEQAPPAIAAITAAELLIGVERADTPQRRSRRESFVQSILDRVPIIPFDMAQARLFAMHFADLATRGEMIGDRDLQIAVTALSLDFDLATLNQSEFNRVTGLKVRDVSAYVP
ncbi:MAG TPA: PIN domain-containing protein [Pirellulales bacterium]|nr:PIN domain-containing protein [Pirellulales bacterium]